MDAMEQGSVYAQFQVMMVMVTMAFFTVNVFAEYNFDLLHTLNFGKGATEVPERVHSQVRTKR